MKTSERIWQKDVTLWSDDPKVGETISNRLGWLDSVEKMETNLARLDTFVSEVQADGFSHVVLLGMGGSSLCPDVLRTIFPQTKGLELQICDSTDPESIRRVESSIDLAKTLFIIASKSGGTIEIVALTDYFWGKCPNGRQFVAITDPETKLEAQAKEKDYREVFVNPADIGGRFSALSFFGLVPAALLGIDLATYLRNTKKMIKACKNKIDNPGENLGRFLAEELEAGRNKLTLRTSPNLAILADWIEQLIAESTGKECKGILPIVGGPELATDQYGPDRCLFTIDITDPMMVGAEFFRWMFATAVVGARLGINPFDEPDVRKSKDFTNKVLDVYDRKGEIPGFGKSSEIKKPFLETKPGDFVAILAFVPPTEEIRKEFQALRTSILREYGVATTLGFGPRYLHSIGQYYKGGPNKGHFLFFTCDDQELPIPGRKYGFSVLKNAQAIGDMEALSAVGRHLIPFHLTGDLASELRQLREKIEKTL